MKVKSAVVILAGAAGVLFCLLVAKLTALNRQAPALIPLPEKMERVGGAFVISPTTRIVADTTSATTAQYLAERLRTSTGYPLAINDRVETDSGNRDIVLICGPSDKDLGGEGYELSARPDAVVIRALQPAGLFYGVQSLLQLLPPAVFADRPVPRVSWRIPCLHIKDKPRFPWRGFMLDVSRHFFKKEEVKQVLDLMAFHKLNTFHWHLTDDQGWRIEIKKYPRLVEVGAWRPTIGFGLDPKSSKAYGPDGRYGGYYSQAEIREIVAFAESRHITVVPEIEMPGHSSAALSAYPELACSTARLRATQRPPDVYCVGNENSFPFLEDILTEVCELFPDRYIHIGGDEVSKRSWRECPLCQARIGGEHLGTADGLQTYFVKRITSFLESKGRAVIGWSEISQGGLPGNVTIMDWLGGAAKVARQGHDVIRCPNTYCYFDYYQTRERESEPPASGAYLPLERVYDFDPIPEGLKPDDQARILGPQANLWTEYIPSLQQIEYMSFPRLCAMAEVGWSRREQRDWSDFLGRLETHGKRLDQLRVNCRKLSLAQ